MNEQKLKKSTRLLLLIFIAGLIVSGITAFPLEWELRIAHGWIQRYSLNSDFTTWIDKVFNAVHDTNSSYPFIAYGTDWLAFAHLVLAVVFVGPLKDPVKNIWVIQFGIFACLGIFPLAMIAGSVREVPFFWQCIDCSFGLIGGSVLFVCLRNVKQLERMDARYQPKGAAVTNKNI